MELQRTLPGISTEQLRSRLNRMVADGLLTRQRYREVPPRVDYELTERSRELLPVVGALARWGYDWSWSQPRQGERVDIGAVLRCAPGLLKPQADGVLDCVVTDEGRHYVLTAHDGSLDISERPVDHPDAVASGTCADWVQALGPGGSTRSLQLRGDQHVAQAILEGLLAISSAANRAA